MPLILPELVAENLRRERMVDEQIHLAREFNRLLKQIDENLSVVLANDQANDPRLVAGRWHVRRRNTHGLPDSYMPITTPNGGYREPDSGVLLELQRRDMWRDGNGPGALQEAQRQRDAESAYRAEQTRGEMREDTALLIKAEDMPGVRFGEKGWTYKAKGKRGRAK